MKRVGLITLSICMVGIFILASCQKDVVTGNAVQKQRLTIQEPPAVPEPGLADFLAILENNPDFQEYTQGYPDYTLKSQEKLTADVVRQKVDALRGGPHEVFVKTYEGLPVSDSLYEVRFNDPRTKNELVAMVDIETKKVHQIYLWVRVDVGASA